MSIANNEGDLGHVNKVLAEFRIAWRASTEDYRQRLINSEHTLQASLYFHLRNALGPGSEDERYCIYTEAVIRRRGSDAYALADAAWEKVFVDLAICRESGNGAIPNRTLLVAIELKFKPMIRPSAAAIHKDLHRLSRVSLRRNTENQAVIEMTRYAGPGNPEALEVSISPQRRLILGIYRAHESGDPDPGQNSIDGADHDGSTSGGKKADLARYWTGLNPRPDFWANRTSMPPKLGLAVAACEVGERPSVRFEGALA